MAGTLSSLGTYAPRIVRDLARLVVPVACPGCGLPDELWCQPCADRLAEPPFRAEAGAGRLDPLNGAHPLPVWAAARYEGAVRRMVIAWKDHGRTDLDRLISAAVVHCAVSATEHLSANSRTTENPTDPGRDPATSRIKPTRPASLLVVPAPSSAKARRSRSRDHLRPVAQAVATAIGGTYAPLLRRARARDQVGLGARERGRNVVITTRRTVVVEPARTATPRQAILVDDVLTTGATLAAAARALTCQGVTVVGAVVLAATPPPSEPAATRIVA